MNIYLKDLYLRSIDFEIYVVIQKVAIVDFLLIALNIFIKIIIFMSFKIIILISSGVIIVITIIIINDRNLYAFYRSLLLNINSLIRFYGFYNRSHACICNSKLFHSIEILVSYIFFDYVSIDF